MILLLNYDLDSDGRSEQELLPLLSQREIALAKSLRAPLSQYRYCLSRAVLRCVLSNFLRMEPNRIQIETGPLGKPVVRGPATFSLSRSANQLLVGVTGSGRLGVDIETLRCIDSVELLAERYFAPEETQYLAALSHGKRTEAFLKLWTAKEAFVKALGLGLSFQLHKIVISQQWRLQSGNPIYRLEDLEEASYPWHVRSLDNLKSAVGAVAWDGGRFDLAWMGKDWAHLQ